VLIAVAATFVVLLLAITFATRHADPYLRARAVEMLREKFHGDVELREFKVFLWPQVRIEGSGLRLWHQGQTDLPPLISVGEFSADAGLRGLVGRPWTIHQVRVKGLVIQIPPAGQRAKQDWSRVRDMPVFIDELISDDGELRLLPKSADKEPHVFELHHLVLHSVGLGKPANFSAQLSNAVPPGEINAQGSFGPWNPDYPGQTPLAADYAMTKADLGVFRGIRGILSSQGKFGGALNKIEVEGTTETPDFSLRTGEHPVSLQTTFSATVDGTNGNTLLHPVHAHFLNSFVTASGEVVKKPGSKGRNITLDVVVDKGRLEDMLRLAVKSEKAIMTGALKLRTKFNLRPAEGDIIDRLTLKGKFGVGGAEFTNPDVSAKIQTLSRKAQGKPGNEDAGSSVSELKGNFLLNDGVVTFRGLTFSVVGADVGLDGGYNLDKESLDFHGKLKMSAKLSQTMTGFKSFFLKPFDPFFRKDGATVLPIKITGTRDHPSFGLDFHHKNTL
jgi:AsmA-like C-terminal region